MKNLDAVPAEEQVLAYYDPRKVDESIPEQRALKENYDTRYEFLTGRVEDHRVLDFCSMTGFGAAILRRQGKAGEVTGLTTNEFALDVARKHFACDGVTYHLVDEDTLDEGLLPEQVTGEYDTIVFVDEFEHYQYPFTLLEKLAGHLKPGGHLYVAAYVTPTMDINPFHKHNIRRNQMRRNTQAIGLHIQDELVLNQHYSPDKALFYARNKKSAKQPGKRSLFSYYIRHPLQAIGRLWSLLRYGFVVQTLQIHAVKPLETS